MASSSIRLEGVHAAYGLLKLESWAPTVATVAFALAIPLGLLKIWAFPTVVNVVMYGGLIVVAAVALVVLRNREVRSLYHAALGERGATA